MHDDTPYLRGDTRSGDRIMHECFPFVKLRSRSRSGEGQVRIRKVKNRLAPAQNSKTKVYFSI